MAAAQTSGAQASGAASTETSVSADRSGAQGDSQAAVNTAAGTSQQGKQSGDAAAGGSSSASAAVGKDGADLAGGTTINAVLSRPLDVKKNKPGDEVTARVQSDVRSAAGATSHVVVPRGSRLIGHVTEARRRQKHHGSKDKDKAAATDSALGIVFDKAILKNGKEVPVHAVLQAVAASQQDLTASAGSVGMSESGSAMGSGSAMAGGSGGGGLLGGGGLVGGAGSTLGATAGTVGNTSAGLGSTVDGTLNTTTSAAGAMASGATTATGQLTSSANGVVGLEGLTLTSAGSGSAQGSVITSSSRDVRLAGGTQMLLRVTGSAR